MSGYKLTITGFHTYNGSRTTTFVMKARTINESHTNISHG